MDAVILREELRVALEQKAEQTDRNLSDLVNEAVEQYLREQGRAKLNQEIAAYEAMHPELRRAYLGQWVAIHNQELVDRDQDQGALYRRVRQRYGRTSVLIRQVKDQPVEEIWVRTPSTGQIAP